MVRLLLDKDTGLGQEALATALAMAVENGHEAVVRLLLENGTDFEFQDLYGRTALAMAVEKWYEGVQMILLEAQYTEPVTDYTWLTAPDSTGTERTANSTRASCNLALE